MAKHKLEQNCQHTNKTQCPNIYIYIYYFYYVPFDTVSKFQVLFQLIYFSLWLPQLKLQQAKLIVCKVKFWMVSQTFLCSMSSITPLMFLYLYHLMEIITILGIDQCIWLYRQKKLGFMGQFLSHIKKKIKFKYQ